ncbi:MAG TPA: VOC family protein [Paenibacillus sp.]|nr:VOC family protein [Paenibacillus sp.]
MNIDFLWDGGFILTPKEQFDEAIEWYSTHMGWTCKANFENVGRMAFLKYPGKGQVVLKSYEEDQAHFVYRQAPESRSRLCFHIENRQKALDYFAEHGIGTSGITVLPNGRETFEIEAFGGTVLTAVTSNVPKAKYPKSRIAGYSDLVMQIGVKDVENMIDFYTNVIGMELLTEVEAPDGYAYLGAKDARSKLKALVVLHPAEGDLSQVTNQSAQPHFWIGPKKKDFVRAWEQLKAEGHQVADFTGDPETWAAFTLLDPENNRINVWNCK